MNTINCKLKIMHSITMSLFSAILWQEQVTFDEMIMMSTLYYTNILSWIF